MVVPAPPAVAVVVTAEVAVAFAAAGAVVAGAAAVLALLAAEAEVVAGALPGEGAGGMDVLATTGTPWMRSCSAFSSRICVKD
jgi:hypothetical protein